MDRELELKLICDASFDRALLLQQLAEHGELTAVEPADQRDVYVDTPHGDLRAAGLSARCRTIAGRRRIDVKPVPLEPELLMDRPELSTEVSSDAQIGSALRDLVRERLGLSIAADAAPVLELHTRREGWRLRASEFEAELVVDSVAVSLPEELTAGRFTEVELELVDGEPLALARLGERLADHNGLTASNQSKYERARTMVDLPPYVYGDAAPELGPKTSLGKVAREFCLAQYRTMRAHEPGTRVGLDPEHLHKMRVAIRRARAGLSIFRRAFKKVERETLADELRWIAQVLGDVRDLDVHLLAVAGWRNRLGQEPARGWESLHRALVERHALARGRLLEALASSRYRKLCTRAQSSFAPTSMSNAPKAARKPIGPEAKDLLRPAARRFRRAHDRFQKTRQAEDAHALRIAAKRLRYGIDLLHPLFGKGVGRRGRRLGAFQDQLGELNDAAQAGDLATELSLAALADNADSAYAHVLGRLEGWATTTTDHAAMIVDRALAELDVDKLLAALD